MYFIVRCVLSCCSLYKGVKLLHRPGYYLFPLLPIGSLLPPLVILLCLSHSPLSRPHIFPCNLAVPLPLLSLVVGAPPSAQSVQPTSIIFLIFYVNTCIISCFYLNLCIDPMISVIGHRSEAGSEVSGLSDHQ